MKRRNMIFLVTAILLIAAGCMLQASETKAQESVGTESVSIGDIVTFGSYEQDNDTSNGKEAIEWIVLDKDDTGVLLISKYALDCQPYDTYEPALGQDDWSWGICTLRSWLNDTFLDAAFNEIEKSEILISTVVTDGNSVYAEEVTYDKIFILQLDEIKKYIGLDEASLCEPTEYAIANGADREIFGDICYRKWWVRAAQHPGDCAAYVIANSGYPVTFENYWETACVRPALWVNSDDLTIVSTAESYTSDSAQESYDCDLDQDYCDGDADVATVVNDSTAAVNTNYNSYSDDSYSNEIDFYVSVKSSAETLNVRNNPGMQADIISERYAGNVLHVIGLKYNSSDGFLWGCIVLDDDNNTGWISLRQTDVLGNGYPSPSFDVVTTPYEDCLNMRSGPGVSYNVIAEIPPQERLHITWLSYNDADGFFWGYTEYAGTIGWISIRQTQLSGYSYTSNNTSAAANDYSYSSGSSEIDFYVSVKSSAGTLNVRNNPGIQADIISECHTGDVLHVTGLKYNFSDGFLWGRITLDDGSTAWISLRQTDVLQNGYPRPDFDVVTTPDAEYLNMRSGPGVSYDVIAEIPPYVTLHVTWLSYNNVDGFFWGYTEYAGTIGWISVRQTQFQ